MTATIHALPSADLPNVARMLRKLADEIDAGDYGETSEAVVVLSADRLEVFGFGAADGTTAHYLLGCAMQRLQSPMVHK